MGRASTARTPFSPSVWKRSPGHATVFSVRACWRRACSKGKTVRSPSILPRSRVSAAHCRGGVPVRRLRVGSVRDLPVGALRQAGDALLNLFFPESCLVCAAPVSRHTERSVCAPCWSRILQLAITPPWCPVCGIPFAAEVRASHVCGRCILEPPPYAGVRSFAFYTGELRTIVHALKFHGRRN